MRVSTIFALISSITTASAFVPGTAFTTRTSVAVNAELTSGTVKWFNTEKGFGFIAPDDGSTDVFVHQTNIIAEGFRSLADGEKVEFETETDDTGRSKAINVTGPDGVEVQGAPFQGGY